jgi:hypothetical protein
MAITKMMMYLLFPLYSDLLWANEEREIRPGSSQKYK